jgi:CheY-like chemotaxis protein
MAPATVRAGDLFHSRPNAKVGAPMSQSRRPIARSFNAIHGVQLTSRHYRAAANDSIRPGRIMVVQDDFLLRMETATDLRQWGYEVVEAFNEAEARRALQADQAIALVLLDVNVGGDQHGLELARSIQECHPETKVLLAAAVAPEADGISVLEKPFRPLDLLQHVDVLLKA